MVFIQKHAARPSSHTGHTDPEMSAFVSVQIQPLDALAYALVHAHHVLGYYSAIEAADIRRTYLIS
jgi:hypothetical protein